MEFRFSEKEERFRAEIREFVKENMPPNHIGCFFEEEADPEFWEFSMRIAKKLAEKKWLTISWPEAFGGMGASHWERVVFAEEAYYWGIPGTGMGVSGTAWVGPSLTGAMISGARAKAKETARGQEPGAPRPVISAAPHKVAPEASRTASAALLPTVRLAIGGSPYL